VGKTIEIMFDDLIESKKEEVLKELELCNPQEMNWDTVPMAIVELEMENEEE
jgi:hypothetical protein